MGFAPPHKKCVVSVSPQLRGSWKNVKLNVLRHFDKGNADELNFSNRFSDVLGNIKRQNWSVIFNPLMSFGDEKATHT